MAPEGTNEGLASKAAGAVMSQDGQALIIKEPPAAIMAEITDLLRKLRERQETVDDQAKLRQELPRVRDALLQAYVKLKGAAELLQTAHEILNRRE